MTIRTRFAPSPTGYLHIGGVRTALFNWLLTRRLGGQFVLRIDDTDAERNRPEALQPILDGFCWLGIHWDEGVEKGGPYAPYYQSQRGQLYRDAVMRLLDSGHAYPSYETKEEKEAASNRAKAEKRNYVFRGQHRDTPPAECRRLYESKPTALCFKVPEGRTIAIDDLIRGRVEWQSDLTGDPTILRADGRPLYNFATVVDDAAMQITHVIRAAEHLTNTAVQVLFYEALGYPLPQFAHVPVVNEPAPKKGVNYTAMGVKPPNPNKKLSKREMLKFVTPDVREKLHAIGWTDEQINSRDDLNPATVAYYRELGYLPEALVNYLGRLGWSLDDKSEFIPLDQMIANFSLDRVNNSAASFDPDKLLWLAGEYMKLLPLEKKVDGVLPFLARVGLVTEPVDAATRERVRQVVAAVGDRLRVFSDILPHAPTFLKRDPNYDPKAVEKKLKNAEAAELLAGFKSILADIQPYEAAALEQALNTFCEQHGVKRNVLVHALRVAVTGSEVGLGLYETLVILGRDETLRRIDLGLVQAR
jgi:glutamyl-tRNA synthetase